MVAPSKSFTVIVDADVDPDSPVTTNLMTELRDNTIHLEEWLGDGFTAAKNHDHNGTNSKKIDAANVLNLGDKALRDIDQTSQDLTTSFADLASITVLAADLLVNKDAFIVVAGKVEQSSNNTSIPELKIVVEGVDDQILALESTAATGTIQTYSLVGLVTLVSGSNRIVKVQGKESSASGAYANTNISLALFLVNF